MDVTCEPGCSFSTGGCSDSVRELAGKPAQYQKIIMASCEDAALLLLLELDSGQEETQRRKARRAAYRAALTTDLLYVQERKQAQEKEHVKLMKFTAMVQRQRPNQV
jgi:hypothetical protein